MGLRIWLPLNGNLENKGLSNITITNNGSTFNSMGKLGGCYNFDNSMRIITNNSITLNTTFSISCWVKVNSWNLNWANVFKIYKGAYDYIGLCMNQTSSTIKQLGFHIYKNNGSNTRVRVYDNYYMPLTLGEWYHLCFTVTPTEMKTYQNGDCIKTATIDSNFPSVSNYILSLGKGLDCSINDFRLYDEALSPMQIKLISQGLVAHYLLNNNGSGNNNLVTGSNTDSLNANAWRYGMQTGGNTKSIELDETNTYCVKIERDNTTHSGWSFLGYNNFLRNKIKTNTPYVLTFDCNASVSGNIIFYNLLDDKATNGMVLRNSIQQIQKNVIANQWNHMVYKFITKDSFDDIQIQSQIIYLTTSTSLKDTGVILKFKNIKLEEGNKPTPWCPNSTDAIYTQLGYDNNIEYDVSGYCNNGTKYNITEYDSNSPRYSVATKFNGTNSYINVGKGGKIKDEITVNIWGYMDDWTKYSGRLISCTEGGGWNFEASSGKIHFAIGTGSTSNVYKNAPNYPLSELSSGWHMFTGTYDGLIVKQYIDGVFTTSNNAYTTKTPIYYNNNNPILIGAEASSSQTPTANYYFKGSISDVRIYATALSESDIASLYNNSAFVDSSGNVYATEYVES